MRVGTGNVLRFRHGQDVERHVSRTNVWEFGAEIPTDVRNDNSDASYQVGSVNTVTSAKRPNGFLESNKEELDQNDWLIVGYIHGTMSASGGQTKTLSSANMRNLSDGNVSRIVIEGKKNGIRRKIPESKHYIVYHATIHGWEGF